MTIKYRWEDCTVGFVCPVCGAELTADSQNGPDECETCGTEYQLVAHIEILSYGAKP